MDEPRILDRYRLLERLAVGGSAEVWRAHDDQLDRPVAVKRLHPHLLPDEASRRRLGAEARAVATLSHPVIVAIYDVDLTGEWPAIVMELVDGEPLAERLRHEGPTGAREAAVVVADLAEALFHAHQRGVIHRDVKPGNVLLAHDGRTRLVDFGIAHSLADAAARLTLTGTVVGTLHAMSPEQLSDGPITPRTDLYGLGVVLHEMLTGAPPYPTGSPIALAEAQRAGPPPMEGLDPALAAVVAACLAHDPSDRPLHAGALAAALRAWLAGDPGPALAMAPRPLVPLVDPDAETRTMPRPVVADPAARVSAEAPPLAPSAAAAASPPPPRNRDPRRRSLVPVLLIALVAVVGAAALSALGRNAPAGALPSSAGASASASASAIPSWVAELAGAIAEACGTDAATEAEGLAGFDEEAARDAADAAVAACADEAPDGGKAKGKGKDKGSENGNGNGNGPGGDD